MDCRERGSHACGVYPYTDSVQVSHTEEEPDTRIIVSNPEERNMSTECPKQGLTSSEEPPIMLTKGRDSLHQRSD